MKRNELKVGTEYAVLSPSQRANGIGRWPNAKRIRVLDTEPVWRARYSLGFRDTAPEVRITGFDSDGRVTAKDRTQRAEDGYQGDEAKRSVRVLTVSRWSRDYYEVVLVPLSQIGMTWAEYERRVESAKRARRREIAKVEADRKAKADKLKADKAQRDEDIATVRDYLGNASFAEDAQGPAFAAMEAFARLHGAA